MLTGLRARAALLGIGLSLAGGLALIAISVIRFDGIADLLDDPIGALLGLLFVLVGIAVVYGVPGAVASLGAAVALRALQAQCSNTIWRLLAVAIGAIGGYGVGLAGDFLFVSFHSMMQSGTISQLGLGVGAIWGILAPGILFSPRVERASSPPNEEL